MSIFKKAIDISCVCLIAQNMEKRRNYIKFFFKLILFILELTKVNFLFL